MEDTRWIQTRFTGGMTPIVFSLRIKESMAAFTEDKEGSQEVITYRPKYNEWVGSSVSLLFNSEFLLPPRPTTICFLGDWAYTSCRKSPNPELQSLHRYC
jgi:hypothetical protein